MLLTLSTTMPNAADLGFLLHKHPDRAQPFEQRRSPPATARVPPVCMANGWPRRRRTGTVSAARDRGADLERQRLRLAPCPGLQPRPRRPYLRAIYGPDCTEPVHLERLRERNLGPKRSLAAREYALGIESLERAVRCEPLWRIHEPVFAVLALESEPVDPRL